QAVVARYREPVLWRALWQLSTTLGLYAADWAAMAWAVRGGRWWLALALAVLGGGFVVRLFVIFHDCVHRSFFRSPWANRVCGFLCGVLCFTPYGQWRAEHLIHHATSGDLDRRGVGDLWTLTVEEYLASSRWRRFAYRLARNPWILFGLAPLYVFVVQQRFPSRGLGPEARRSVWLTDLGIALMAAALSVAVGPLPYLLLQGVVMLVAGSTGLWLFYVQHQFEEVYWARGEAWDRSEAALLGSSYYRLPRLLQWFSANIGFHHIHHLSARIPNYNLERCFRAHPELRQAPTLTLRTSLRTLAHRLWDESSRRMVGFRRLRDRGRGDEGKGSRK
ncbi:MAG: fatty acid desaturase, partial [Nitrospirae bacterium]